MGVREIQAKGILQKSRLPGIEYVINPYTGCVHGCVYCYAAFMKRFTDHPEPWGSFLDAKSNAPQLLEGQLTRRRRPLTECVLLSSVTDPYQPPERTIGLTRKILEVLRRHGVPVEILTKSDLVLRDADLLGGAPGATVGLSLGTTDDGWAKLLEPRATPPSRRLAALAALRERGIRAYAFVSPYIPGLSDIRRIVDALHGITDSFAVEAINTSAGGWSRTLEVIGRRDSTVAETAKRYAADSAYWRDVAARAGSESARAGMRMTGFYRHKS